MHRPLTVGVLLVSVFLFTATQFVKDRLVAISDNYLIKEKHAELETSLRNSSSIRSVKIRRYDEISNNPAPDDQNTYFFDVTVTRAMCDSPSTLITFLIEEEKSGTVVRGIDARFECRAYETTENYEELDERYGIQTKAIFEEEILNRLSVISTK